MPSRRRIRAVLPVLALAGGLLTACTSNPVGVVVTPAPSASASSAPIAVPTPTTPPPVPSTDGATPVDLRCSKLVPTSVLQMLAPELQRQRDWTPEAGSLAARLADLGGTACSWTDASGNLLEVAIAEPSKKDATRLKNDLVRRSNSVPTYGGEAYFQIVDHIGRVNAFRGRTWIWARSNRFFEPGDAAQVVAAVDQAAGTTPASQSAGPTPTPTAGAPTPSATP